MTTLDNYLEQYKESHQNPTNIKIHFVCVPLIMWSVLGVLHTFRLGAVEAPLSYILAGLGLLYYVFLKNVRVVLVMFLMTALMLASFNLFPSLGTLREISIVVFVLAWIGQFYGHKIEGKKPSFFKDLLFLLIGPVWIVKKLFPKWV